MKCFSNFFKCMKSICKKTNTIELFDDLFYALTDYDHQDNDPIASEHRTQKCRYINGVRPITPFINKIKGNLCCGKFSNWLIEEYNDILSDEENKQRIYNNFKKDGIILDKSKEINDEIENIFREIILNYSNALPSKKIYEIKINKKKDLESIGKSSSKQIISVKNKIQNELCAMVPTTLKDHFDVCFDSNDELTLVGKTKESYINFPHTFSIELNNSFNFYDLINEANIKGYAQINSIKSISDYYGGIPNPLSPYSEIDNDIKCYVGKCINPKEIFITIKVHNTFMSFTKRNIKLQLLSFDRKTNNYFFSNKWINEWFDCSLEIHQEITKKTFKFNLNIRNKFSTEINHYIEIYKYLITLDDKNSVFELMINSNSTPLLKTFDFGTREYNYKDYSYLNDNIRIMQWLYKIQESNNVKLIFNIDEFNKERDLLLILYNTSNNNSTKLNKKICLKLNKSSDSSLNITDKINITIEFDYIDIFSCHLFLDIANQISIIGEVTAINKDNIIVSFNEATIINK